MEWTGTGTGTRPPTAGLWCEDVDYDQLTAVEITAALTGLGHRDLAAVAARERAGKQRVTVLRQVDRLQGSAPRPAGRLRRELASWQEGGTVVDLDAATAWDPPPFRAAPIAASAPRRRRLRGLVRHRRRMS